MWRCVVTSRDVLRGRSDGGTVHCVINCRFVIISYISIMTDIFILFIVTIFHPVIFSSFLPFFLPLLPPPRPQDYECAASMYKLVKDDFKSDKSVLHLAHASLMAAICHTITGGRRHFLCYQRYCYLCSL